MKNVLVRECVLALCFGSIAANVSPAEISRTADQPRLAEREVLAKELEGMGAALPSGPRVAVSKTAFVAGEEVCGVIRITNGGSQPAVVDQIVDTLEVHFPRGLPAPPLPAGSTSNWFRVADVPVALPGPIAPGTSVNIDYCFSLCLTLDFDGANSIRNVVTITVAGRNFTTRSVSFPPPALDCQACCLGTGACRDTLAQTCTDEGGRPQGADTDCSTIECPEACCLPGADHPCSDEGASACRNEGGEPQGAGTECASTQCCEPLGEACSSFSDCCEAAAECVDDTCCLRLAETGCAAREDCCEENGIAICEGGRCCAPNRTPDSCHDSADCCDSNATCQAGTCCIGLGATGCTNLVGNDCCETFGAVICEAGRCCAPTGATDSCTRDSDCCDPGATCNAGTCCVRMAETGCEDQSDCCDEGFATVICDGGKCCAPNGTPDSCHDAADCCDANATCNAGSCCIELGASGCTDLFGNDCCVTLGAVICEAGRCCGPTGASDSCFGDSDCCDPNATCNGGTCCIATASTGCSSSDDCCETLCIDQTCCNPAGAFCGQDVECCNGLPCDGGLCCMPSGSTCGIFDACCGTPCINGTCCNPPGSNCAGDVDCCDGICQLGSCCLSQFDSGCTQDADCCSGLVCAAGTCEGVLEP